MQSGWRAAIGDKSRRDEKDPDEGVLADETSSSVKAL